MLDALVVGAGPAGLAMAAALCDAGLAVAGVAPRVPDTPWPNTYGIWADELAPLGLTQMLAHRWSDCVVYAGERRFALQRDYGLFDNARLQAHLLARTARSQVVWHRGHVAQAVDFAAHTHVTTREGGEFEARVVVDASGHRPILVRRPSADQVAYQAAYGIVGRFSAPPVEAGQMVLMDYRADHLAPAELDGPPTFLYAMDLGGGRYFVEETSLAHVPAVPLDLLERRLYRRLAQRDIQVVEVEHVERCLFPMNLPLPLRDQPVLGFGGAASMVHPASGYQVGAALSRAPVVAQALAAALDAGDPSPAQLARAGWETLWPAARVRRRHLYLFGLANVLRFDVRQTQDFFATFFQLPREQWSGYLSDTLSTPELLQTMLRLFKQAPAPVRTALLGSVGPAGGDLWRALKG